MRNNNLKFKNELLRVGIYLILIGIYLTSEIGFVLGGIHLFLILKNHKKYGMSRFLQFLISKI